MLEKMLVSLINLSTDILKEKEARIKDLEAWLDYEQGRSIEYLRQLKLAMAANGRKRDELRLQHERNCKALYCYCVEHFSEDGKNND